MVLDLVIRDALESVAKIKCTEPNEDQMLVKLEQERKGDVDRVRNQIDDAEREIATLNESLRDLEESLNSKTLALEEKKNQLITKSSELEAIREDAKKNDEKLAKLRERKLKACSEFSVTDVAALEDTKMKLHVCCTLTGVHFNSSDESVSSGYVANAATSQVKLFDISGLPRKEAAKKIWETIEKTTALHFV
uniref:Epidermal growth factor receptor substrate 15-like 1 n=1 Tax=Lygus hesperus TaxID=30085 RepID=A0A0A9XAM1_LYGHE